jgi:hypothetical protein
MKATRSRVPALGFALACALGLAVTDAAAKTTATSTISQMTVLAKSHPSYEQFHGAIWLEYDKARENYRWGGKQCGADLSDIEVSMLFAAFRAKQSLSVEYSVRRGSDRSIRCLTGFTLRN